MSEEGKRRDDNDVSSKLTMPALIQLSQALSGELKWHFHVCRTCKRVVLKGEKKAVRCFFSKFLKKTP